MKTLVFSKDRPFQLYSLLETYKKYVRHNEDHPEVFVQFRATNDDYMNGYLKLNEIFDDVEFINEHEYGFQNTFRAIVEEFGNDRWMSFECDDVVYFDTVDMGTLENIADTNYSDTCGRAALSLRTDIFDPSGFDVIHKMGGYAVVDREAPIKDSIQDMCLKYPFNVQGVLHKTEDVKRFLNSVVVTHPISTEIEGSKSPVFYKYKYVLYVPVQKCTYCHFNNVLKRYDETHTNQYLLDLFNQRKVVDWDKVDIPSLEQNMHWFKTGDTAGRPFPIFPWDVDPKYHSHIIENCLKTL